MTDGNVKTCPECSAPVGEDMWPTVEHGCWYVNQYAERMRRDGRDEKSIDAMRMSGFDPPCDGNKYDYDHRQNKARVWPWVVALFVSAAAISIWVILK